MSARVTYPDTYNRKADTKKLVLDKMLQGQNTSQGDLQTQINAKSAGGYVLAVMQNISFSPLDSTTYFWGGDISAGMSTVFTDARVEVPKAGTLKRFWFKLKVAGTLGSAETVSHFLRINDTTDIGQIDTTYNAARMDLSTTLNTAVVAGDYIAVKVNAPAWVTNPTQVRMWGSLYIE